MKYLKLFEEFSFFDNQTFIGKKLFRGTNGAELGNFGNNNYPCLLECEINEEYIDWDTTYEMNVDINFSDEKEIRLFKNTKLRISKIIFNDKELNLTDLGIVNKTFLA